MLRFLHTADLQIGMTAKSTGEFAPKLQAARCESLRRILKLASEHRAQFVIVAGDLFETNLVSSRLVGEVLRLLENARPLKIYILPGNHDHLGAGSVYAREEFRAAGGHIRIFSEPAPCVDEELDLTLYPVPCLESRSADSPAGKVSRKAITRYHVAVLHGSVPERFGKNREEDEYFPMREEELRGLGMDYIALGHMHSLQPDPGEDPASPFYYPGTPEPTGFGEKKSGYALLVELQEGHRTVKALESAEYRFADVTREIRTRSDSDHLRQELLQAPFRPERTLLRIELKGIVSFDVLEAVERLMSDLRERFAVVRDEMDELLVEPDERDLARFTPGGIAQTALALLKAKRNAAPAGERHVYDRAISLAYKSFSGKGE